MTAGYLVGLAAITSLAARSPNPAPHARSRRSSARSLRPQRTAGHRPARRAPRACRHGRAARANRSRGRRGRGPSAIPSAVSACGGSRCRGSETISSIAVRGDARRRRRLPAPAQNGRRKSLRCRAGRTGADDSVPISVRMVAPRRLPSLGSASASSSASITLSARPSGRSAAASTLSGSAGWKRIVSSAIRLVGTVTMTLSAVSVPCDVSMRSALCRNDRSA